MSRTWRGFSKARGGASVLQGRRSGWRSKALLVTPELYRDTLLRKLAYQLNFVLRFRGRHAEARRFLLDLEEGLVDLG